MREEYLSYLVYFINSLT